MVTRWWLPLGCYYLVTLAIPLANGAAGQGAAFADHALIVFALPLLLIGMISVARIVTRALDRFVRRATHIVAQHFVLR